MAAKFSLVVEIPGTGGDGYSNVYRNSTHPEEVVEGFLDGFADKPVKNCWDLFEIGLRGRDKQPFLGSREVLSKPPLQEGVCQFAPSNELKFGKYKWVSCLEGKQSALTAGSGFLNLNLIPESNFPDEYYQPARKMKLMGMQFFNCNEWFYCEQAANAFGFTLVPLYDTLGQDALLYILRLTELQTVVACRRSLSTLKALKSNSGVALKNLIIVDECLEKEIKELEDLGLKVYSWADVMTAGAKQQHLPLSVEPHSVQTICFTSGTTGVPKGVIMTHRNFVACIAAALRGPLGVAGVRVSPDDTHISYLPLAHTYERIICNLAFVVGAKIGVFSGHITRLMDDVKYLKPTCFVSVPRVFEKIENRVATRVSHGSKFSNFLFNFAVQRKLQTLQTTNCCTSFFWDRLIFNKIASYLGGKVRFLIVGGAPMDSEIQEKMSVYFSCPFIQGFGMTETLGASFATLPGASCGNVGAPLPCLEFKIRSVPEMNYTTDSENPSGELLLRGYSVTPGYFMNKKEVFKASGDWLKTGDVVTLLPCGSLKVVDRIKSMFKLSQGEYVSPELVEAVYCRAPFVEQMFAFGYSTKSFLVAIIVVDRTEARSWMEANDQSEDTTIEEICRDEDFKAAVFQSLKKEAGELKGYEKVQAITLTSNLFTVDNKLLTPTFKIRRHEVYKAYEADINRMYGSTSPTAK